MTGMGLGAYTLFASKALSVHVSKAKRAFTFKPCSF